MKKLAFSNTGWNIEGIEDSKDMFIKECSVMYEVTELRVDSVLSVFDKVFKNSIPTIYEKLFDYFRQDIPGVDMFEISDIEELQEFMSTIIENGGWVNLD